MVYRDRDKERTQKKEYYRRPEVKVRVRKYGRKYRKRPEVKIRRRECRRKYSATNRCLGFSPLNQWSDGLVMHHIDKEHVLFIPSEIHRSIRHSQNRPETMEQINTVAFCWILGKVAPGKKPLKMTTTIAISASIRDRLKAVGKRGETYNSILRRLLDCYK